MFAQVILFLSPLGKDHTELQLFHTKIILDGNIKGRGIVSSEAAYDILFTFA